jgi:hypothetical protein
MSQIEDLLRAATRETAAEITPDSVPRLDVATLPLPRRRPFWRFSGPFAPLLAAAAVVLVVVLSLVLTSVIAVTRPPAGPAGPAGAPPYYVALTATGTPAGDHPVVLTIRSTATGKVLAKVAAPRPYGTFNLVQGTADDQTFLVGAQVWHPQTIGGGSDEMVNNIPPPVRLYWLRFDQATSHATLAALPVPQFNGQDLNLVSVSPDGTRLAVQLNSDVILYDLSDGTEHTVPFAAQQGYIGWNRDNPASIGWTADDRTMSFLWAGTNQLDEMGVQVASTAVLTRSNSLLAASHVALPMPAINGTAQSEGFSCDTDPMLSANGKYILCGGWLTPKGYKPSSKFALFPDVYPKGPVTQGFAEFSVTTGKLITILGAWRTPLPTIRVHGELSSSGNSGPTITVVNLDALPRLLWASADGTTVIGTANGRGITVHDGRSQAIPWSALIAVPAGSSVPGAAW